MNKIPQWLKLELQRVLIGEIYPSIRAIAVACKESKKLTVRYYLDREPTEGDLESLSMVLTQLEASSTSGEQFDDVIAECRFSSLLLRDVDVMDGLVYARREYCLEEIENQQAASSNP